MAGDKINTLKSVALLSTNNEKFEKEIKKTISFTIASRRIRCLGINLNKRQKYLESYKTLLKEISEDIH